MPIHVLMINYLNCMPQMCVLSISYLNSMAQTVLPTGRYFGRKTQKWPHKNLSGRKNPRPNFWHICLKMAEK
jgi:hypothetical protein